MNNTRLTFRKKTKESLGLHARFIAPGGGIAIWAALVRSDEKEGCRLNGLAASRPPAPSRWFKSAGYHSKGRSNHQFSFHGGCQTTRKLLQLYRRMDLWCGECVARTDGMVSPFRHGQRRGRCRRSWRYIEYCIGIAQAQNKLNRHAL